MASAVERGADLGQRQNEKKDSKLPCLDNAWLCPSLVIPDSPLHFTGVSAVATPPRHPLIASSDFADDLGRPSDHCPIYFDLALQE